MRNVIPPVYAVLILAGFLISATAGVIVLIVGGALSGLLWSTLSRGGGGGQHGGRERGRVRVRARGRDEREAAPVGSSDAGAERAARAADRAARRVDRP